MSPFNQQKEELSDSSKNLFSSRPFSNDNLRKNFHTIVSNSSGRSNIGTRNAVSHNVSQDSQSNTKINSLVEDFNVFKKMFSAPRHKEAKRKRKKAKIVTVPNIVKQESNISEDSNDPKRRRNVVGSFLPFNESIVSKIPLPNIDQSIYEEPFHSEDLSDKSESKKKDVVK